MPTLPRLLPEIKLQTTEEKTVVRDRLHIACSALRSRRRRTDREPGTAGADAESQFDLHVGWKPRVNPWLIAMTVALAAFMEVLDTSIANVALPHIGGSLGASTDEATWVLTSYLVSNAIVLPLGGWACSRDGPPQLLRPVHHRLHRRELSLRHRSLPAHPAALPRAAGRGRRRHAAHGAGHHGRLIRAAKRGQAFALYGLVAVLAPSIGPTLGGWITDNFSWRWIFFINIPVGILAFILVTRLVEDPPWIKADRSRLRNMDYVGLAFLTLAMGGMQIMLDKGEENDWFSSPFICFFAVLFVVGIIGLFAWEWQQERSADQPAPLPLQNFAICCFLMMLVGGVLNANTVLQPQFTQQLLGYTATTAGLALTDGGITLVFMMPLAGIATGKISARYLAAFGFMMLVITFRYAADVTNLQMSFAEASWLRVVQMFPLPFCFISITTAAYVGMPKEQSNQVAGLINFVRNIGGCILIAITNAQVTSRSCGMSSTCSRPCCRAPSPSISTKALTGLLNGSFGRRERQRMALGPDLSPADPQAQTQGYQDVYMELSWASIVLICLAFMLSKNRPGEGAAAVECTKAWMSACPHALAVLHS